MRRGAHGLRLEQHAQVGIVISSCSTADHTQSVICLLLYLMQINVAAKGVPHDFTPRRGLRLRGSHQVVKANVGQIRLLAVAPK